MIFIRGFSTIVTCTFFASEAIIRIKHTVKVRKNDATFNIVDQVNVSSVSLWIDFVLFINISYLRKTRTISTIIIQIPISLSQYVSFSNINYYDYITNPLFLPSSILPSSILQSIFTPLKDCELYLRWISRSTIIDSQSLGPPVSIHKGFPGNLQQEQEYSLLSLKMTTSELQIKVLSVLLWIDHGTHKFKLCCSLNNSFFIYINKVVISAWVSVCLFVRS